MNPIVISMFLKNSSLCSLNTIHGTYLIVTSSYSIGTNGYKATGTYNEHYYSI